MPTVPPSSQAAGTGQLDPGPDDADRVAARGDAGHQPVARAGSEARADVAAGRDTAHEDRDDEVRRARREGVGLGQQPQEQVGEHADEQHVADRPDPGRCRSGIHASITTAPAMMIHAPMDRPKRRDRPWWKTSHGSFPRPDDTWSAIPKPYKANPT